MPLVTRNIEPRHLCRQTLPNVRSELECVTNITLANVIRQLGSLSKFAEDIFGELFTQANTFAFRVSSLVERVDRLQVKVTQLDPKEEEVSLQGINTRKAFKSSTIQDQKLFDRDSLPVPVLETYSVCNMPPPLNNLSSYRDDGKEALKFYTNPSYFFDLWKEKMLQDTKDIMKEKRKHRKEKKDNPNRGNVNPRKIKSRKEEWEKMKMGQEFVEPREKPGGYPSNMVYQNGSIGSNESVDANYYPPPPQPDSVSPSPPAFTDDSLPPPPMEFTYPAHNQSSSGGLKKSSLVSPSHPPPAPPVGSPQGARPGFAPPPAPPPPPPMTGVPPPPPLTGFPTAGIPPPPSPPSFPPHPDFAAPPPPPPPVVEYAIVPTPQLSQQPGNAPPPPPPPPPPGPPPSSFGSMDGSEAPLPQSDSVPSKPKSSLPAVSEARSDLLSAIRQGFQLRKVEEQREQEKRDVVGNDVATILSRRIAVEYSDSEDDSSEFDEDDWSD
ncbi:wiskott-Aldrich syndrome protein family member 2 [Sceloporus undulatus]|uniref:wiskott-Aldrich syndrome protein family member 2 n=1 Tax=Sceloporus undulatus TaxID=8520 RepID=UPI001C4BEC1D|nr:wiskott-Aldrich syndrome protein family member 2 [Sceloporus undulatus]XP_042295323.1 wiskott-Aldrich syndrome protein family member 2 [Sceloporus undulatus]XP_042295324.1 wiskott-Aldrich syndrome protein family member 2 [Sceloporus undulatus]XP_042295325.1 wiskott-Aldrich syndrome protein family member 2 [Sceloporus undulatus]XP_042295326.1 wiskott-Aldrich syndrome protein family member 2 [Sceloporus undulatus]XP_042295327.1 wiskott-Aldrich syndrome protein family member 2 [Sceloporus undu